VHEAFVTSLSQGMLIRLFVVLASITVPFQSGHAHADMHA